MGWHIPHGIAQCYLPPDTSKHTLPNKIYSHFQTDIMKQISATTTLHM